MRTVPYPLDIEENTSHNEYSKRFMASINVIDYMTDVSIKNKVKVQPIIKKKKFYKEGMKCCYCKCFLYEENCTREHVIPRHKGGNMILPCCFNCNNEKGGLMLDEYITILKNKDFEIGTKLFTINNIKIENAIRIKQHYGL